MYYITSTQKEGLWTLAITPWHLYELCAEPIKLLRVVTWPCCTHKNFITFAFASVHHANLWQKTGFSDLHKYSYHMYSIYVSREGKATSLRHFWSVKLDQLLACLSVMSVLLLWSRARDLQHSTQNLGYQLFSYDSRITLTDFWKA